VRKLFEDPSYISRLCWTTRNVTDALSYLVQFLATTQTFHQVYHTIMEFI